ncbi:hypothetical protein IDSA_10125 [Pseudidiomarina salinarum]|uniref:TonB C-terminal domain-containing protein n=1 Tax=Pseudidiomarina salinarum TaxID=435908 RepID=A0A094IX74_9GAMM|nr:energy transducer TonB [Pseudidiomarina salinarum]KFZ30414.1 hypothetical protein IDSA_10125 [Pseudidiomarina salinarum]RUO68562.1 energy transducer TonB [Pseudidiomarina salinarum]
MKYLILALASLFLFACQSQAPSKDYKVGNLNTVEGLLTGPEWADLQRFPPRYPVEEALSGTEGCATVEYVITPDYTVQDISVIESTSKEFAAAAKENIEKWKWSELPAGRLQEPVRTQTRFEFCLEEFAGKCAEEKLANNSQCTGADVVASVGRRVN